MVTRRATSARNQALDAAFTQSAGTHLYTSRVMLERLAALQPKTLACMHGSAWRGDGAAWLRALADSVESGYPCHASTLGRSFRRLPDITPSRTYHLPHA